MIVTLTETDEGNRRLYATRFATVVTYFTETEDGGVFLNTEPGWAAMPHDYIAARDSVAEAVVAELATRLGIEPSMVLQQRFRDLAAVADPELPAAYRYASRGRTRGRNFQTR